MTEPYRPANGEEGYFMMARLCDRCACEASDPYSGEGDPCPILTKTFAIPIDHPDYPPQWVMADDGPTCTAFIADTGQGWIDPYGVERAQAAYSALRRDPITGRPVIA